MFSLPPTLRSGAIALCFAALAFAAAPLRAAEAELFTPFLPPAGKHTGGAVLIVPHPPASAEAIPVARWLNARGLAAFVLRASATPAEGMADLSRAMRILRSRASEFEISPTRLAALGLGDGAALAANAAYNQAVDASADAADPLGKFSDRPDLLGLIGGGHLPDAKATKLPPTFIVGTSAKIEGATDLVALWIKLRALQTSVDAHFFAKAVSPVGLATDDPSLGTWPEMFFNWVRFNGLLTDEARLALKGLVYLDGRTLPQGYVILTPVDFAGVGPVIARVFNSTASAPLGQFIVPASQGPIAGRYKVDVRQNMNRWLSNAFTGGLTRGTSIEQTTFGRYRRLDPSIEDQKSFTKVRPTDAQDYFIEIKPGADTNLELKLEVFSK